MLPLGVTFVLMAMVLGAELRGSPGCEDKSCSHDCTLRAGVPTCTCPPNLTLAADKKTCQEPLTLLLGMYRGISLYTEGTGDLRSVVQGRSSAFDFHYARREIFAHINNSITIHSINDKRQKPKTLLKTDTMATSLAVDWVNDNLYWICEQKSAIESASINGSNHRVVVSHNETTKAAHWHHLVVEPYIKKLFWLGDTHVFSSDLAGAQVQARLPGVGGQLRPENIALDTRQQLVYVIGSRSAGGDKVVVRSKYDGSHVTEVVNVGQPGCEVFGFGVLGNLLYWESNYDGENLYKCAIPKSGEKSKAILVEELYQVVYDMKIFHPDIQKPMK